MLSDINPNVIVGVLVVLCVLFLWHIQTRPIVTYYYMRGCSACVKFDEEWKILTSHIGHKFKYKFAKVDVNLDKPSYVEHTPTITLTYPSGETKVFHHQKPLTAKYVEAWLKITH